MEHYAVAAEIDSWTVDTSSWRTAAEPSSTGAKPLDVYAVPWKTASPAAHQITNNGNVMQKQKNILKIDMSSIQISAKTNVVIL